MKKSFIYVAGAALLAMVFIGYNVAIYQNKNIYTITVEDKETKKGSETSKYLIFADVDGETKVFENTDALFVGKFNSSDLYGRMKVGETYEVETIGFRIDFLSSYENIVKIVE